MKVVLLAFLIASPASLVAKQKTPEQYAIPIPPAPDFSAFSWLVGQWTGRTTAKSPEGNLQFSAKYGLGKRVMILRETVSFGSTKTTPPTDESLLGILAPGRSPSSFDLQVYSSTGFVSRYQVTADGDTINIEPAGGLSPPPGMLFRRTLKRDADGGFTETVQVSPPSKSFFNYYTARFVPETSQPPSAKPPVEPPAKPNENPSDGAQ